MKNCLHIKKHKTHNLLSINENEKGILFVKKQASNRFNAIMNKILNFHWKIIFSPVNDPNFLKYFPHLLFSFTTFYHLVKENRSN